MVGVGGKVCEVCDGGSRREGVRGVRWWGSRREEEVFSLFGLFPMHLQ